MADPESSDWDESDDDIQQLLLKYAQDAGLSPRAVAAAAAVTPQAQQPAAAAAAPAPAQVPVPQPVPSPAAAPAAGTTAAGRRGKRAADLLQEPPAHQQLPLHQHQQRPKQQQAQQRQQLLDVVDLLSDEDEPAASPGHVGCGDEAAKSQQLPTFEVLRLPTPPRKRRAAAAAAELVMAAALAEGDDSPGAPAGSCQAATTSSRPLTVGRQQQQQQVQPPLQARQLVSSHSRPAVAAGLGRAGASVRRPVTAAAAATYDLQQSSDSPAAAVAAVAAVAAAALEQLQYNWQTRGISGVSAGGSGGGYMPPVAAADDGAVDDNDNFAVAPLPAPAAAGAGSRKGRGPKLTAEERAAQKAERDALKAAEKAQKAAEKAAQKVAAKQRKEQEAADKKTRREMESTSSKMDSTDHAPATMVVQWTAATAASKLGQELSVAMEGGVVLGIKRWCCYQVVPSLPLGQLRGCHCFLFKRRMMTAADFHNYRVGGTVQLASFVEDLPVPMVQLVYDDPEAFAEQLMGDGLRSVLAAAAAAHPDCTLCVGVIGLDSWAQKEDNKCLKQGTVFAYPKHQLQERMLQLQLTCPPLLLRKLPKLPHALLHITYLARQLALQPLQDPDKMEACAAVPDINALMRTAEAAGEAVGPATKTMIGALSLMRNCGINHAWAIVDRFHGLGRLMSELDAYLGPGHKLLQDLEQKGGRTGRRLGPVVSKRLVKLLTSTDPDELLEGPEDGDEGQ